MLKTRGLRRRWLLNIVSVVCTLGLVCVMAITAFFAVRSYAALESDLYDHAKLTADFFAGYADEDYQAFYSSCITYTQTFDSQSDIRLDFIAADGTLAASSGETAGSFALTPDVSEAMNIRTPVPYVGSDPTSAARIMTMSAPLIFRNGEVVGVLRYASGLQRLDIQIFQVAGICLFALIFIAAVVFFFSNYYMKSVLIPLGEITEKANKITNGTYGIQITTKYDDEVGDLAKAINEMSLKLSQNEKVQTEFISSLSHELRTPLTAITGWSETLLSSESVDDVTSRGMKIILGEARRLTEMVTELLDFTRIQDGRMTLNMELTDVKAEFEDTVYMYGSRLAQDGIELAYLENDLEMPEISCDGRRLRQVFLNILDNAAKHGGEGKRIQATIDCDEEMIRICIQDFGPGIPEDELPLVKRKFYKGSSKARGTGIGLAVCDEIVGMHGGELLLENAQGGGTLVTVKLPISQ